MFRQLHGGDQGECIMKTTRKDQFRSGGASTPIWRGARSQETQRQLAQRRAAVKQEQEMAKRGPSVSSALGAGVQAPAFELHSTPDQTVQLSDFRGRPVVLIFYPADWSPVCGDQLALYNEILQEFSRLGAQLLGISVDGAWC